VKSVRLPQLPDELVVRAEDAGSILEISSSHAKAEWAPPRIVRVDGDYYRLESTAGGRGLSSIACAAFPPACPGAACFSTPRRRTVRERRSARKTGRGGRGPEPPAASHAAVP